MLPSASGSLEAGGLSPRPAAFAVIGCFLGGVVGIQLISRLLHRYIPSHVVNCDDTHNKREQDIGAGRPHDHRRPEISQTHTSDSASSEDTPLLSRADLDFKPRLSQRSMSAYQEVDGKPSTAYFTPQPGQKPSLQSRLSSIMSARTTLCDRNGPCHGYLDPSAKNCSKALNRNFSSNPVRFSDTGSQPRTTLLRTATEPHSEATSAVSTNLPEEAGYWPSRSQIRSEESRQTMFRGYSGHHNLNGHGYRSSAEEESYDPESNLDGGGAHKATGEDPANNSSQGHHHHVPTNAFLAIGLQTSIAIALHKLPEGFITYATNHANPELGFSVFMALFIHNITEGFALALPLYLAISSRWKAMFWSSILGGASQPLGAGIAALWFKAAGRGTHAPGQTVYGCMFAITAGIMASVALQLFSESLGLAHNRTLCIAFSFLGMGILGVSFALTAS
ncbi:hypothetical protein G7Y79_00035g070260 [Physcia stellaris]|nr:hypothetical protein G7Y79_00035g070260 [Physcia stellaris]